MGRRVIRRVYDTDDESYGPPPADDRWLGDDGEDLEGVAGLSALLAMWRERNLDYAQQGLTEKQLAAIVEYRTSEATADLVGADRQYALAVLKEWALEQRRKIILLQRREGRR